MPNLPIPIHGKKLMEKWSVDVIQLWRILKLEKDQIHESFTGDEPEVLGSFNTQVEIARLILSDDIPINLNMLSEVEFSPSFAARCEKKYALVSQPEEVEYTKESHENFVKSLKFYYENDYEIKIQEPGKKSKSYTCETLGFRGNDTKAWKIFIGILQEHPYHFCMGPAHKNSGVGKERIKDYDSNQKKLSQIDKKLRGFLNQYYTVQIPEDYKLYELCKNEKPGTYKFKFRVVSEDDINGYREGKFENLSVAELKKELSQRMEQYGKHENEADKDDIMAIAGVLESKGIPKDEIWEEINPEKEKIIYDPHENVEDIESDY